MLPAPATAPTTGPATVPVPDASQRNSALRQIEELRERHPLEYGASRLLGLAKEEGSSPAVRYAAAYRALELAATAGHVRVALAALDHLERTYSTDPLQLREHLLEQLLKSPERSAAAILAMRWTEDLYRDGNIKAAAGFARTVERCRLELPSELQHAADAYLEDYRHAMAGSPALISCLYRGDSSALPALADGSEPLGDTRPAGPGCQGRC